MRPSNYGPTPNFILVVGVVILRHSARERAVRGEKFPEFAGPPRFQIGEFLRTPREEDCGRNQE